MAGKLRGVSGEKPASGPARGGDRGRFAPADKGRGPAIVGANGERVRTGRAPRRILDRVEPSGRLVRK